ncbi:MAG: hypothetical protein IKF99_17645 [Oscillospiraceae bacterium]|nr:hypothetical protein [Oscillospiraceae bacterium]
MGSILTIVLFVVLIVYFIKKKLDKGHVENAPTGAPDTGSVQRFESVPVRGAAYYQSAIEKNMEENPDWFKDYAALKAENKHYKIIYRYKYTQAQAQLIPEPTNPHDKNAVMVCVNGDKVGYVAAEECARVLQLIRAGKIDRATASLKGGPAKRIFDDGQEARDAEDFKVLLDLRLK